MEESEEYSLYSLAGQTSRARVWPARLDCLRMVVVRLL